MSAAAATVDTPRTGVLERVRAEVSAGNLGSWPVLIVLVILVGIFSFVATNFFSATNFINIITQMGGTTMLAYGVVFVLLIGEIDLSISYVSGVAAVVIAEMTIPGSGRQVTGLIAILLALLVTAAIGALQGSFVAYIGVPAFVVTLAGYQVWQGVIQKGLTQGVLVLQDRWIGYMNTYFFSATAGWIIAAVVLLIYGGSLVNGVLSKRRHGVPVTNGGMLITKFVAIAAVTVVTVTICNHDRGVPSPLVLMVVALLVLTFLAKRTLFGRHVYAVGGNAEAARRAGINVPRIRILVFIISSTMAGIGGIMLASRLNSVDLNAGGGTLLIDAISAAVIGGTSLFGGRGEVRDALLGSAVIAVIFNGLQTLNYSQGMVYIVTGITLLAAVTLDTVLRRRQRQAGR